MSPDDAAARMELGPDAWHQTDDGFYVDCPECGSAATLSNVVAHGRCNGYLDDQEGETDLDEASMSCTAKLSLELVYRSDPDTAAGDEDVGEASSTDDEGDPGEGRGIDDEAEADASTDDIGAGEGSDVDGTVE